MDKNSKDTVWWTSDEYKNDNHPASEEAWSAVKDNDEFVFRGTTCIDTSHNIDCAKFTFLTFFIAFQLRYHKNLLFAGDYHITIFKGKR